MGLFTDLTLYAEALEIALEEGWVNTYSLQRELRPRLQKMRLVQRQSIRTVERLIRELRAFGWLQRHPASKKSFVTARHTITSNGREALNISRQKPRKRFRRLLASKMQEVYVIPGWFIARLWKINPEGQGELILPAPQAKWRPVSRQWEDYEWNSTLQSQTLAAAKQAREANPSAFLISNKDWGQAVRQAWERLSGLKPRRGERRASFGGHSPSRVSYSPRGRLTLAMREASVKLLFDRVPYGENTPDFPGHRAPIYPRTFSGWCPRLETLELIFYSDWHTEVNGRLLFPVSVFRSEASRMKFERLDNIQNPAGIPLWLHQPDWEATKNSFLSRLIAVHQQLATPNRLLYVSLLDVRDEVCRQLRLSSYCFDYFLEQALKELPSQNYPWSIAVETDIRREQSQGAGQLRRPVYLEGVPHSLLGLARLHHTNTLSHEHTITRTDHTKDRHNSSQIRK